MCISSNIDFQVQKEFIEYFKTQFYNMAMFNYNLT